MLYNMHEHKVLFLDSLKELCFCKVHTAALKVVSKNLHLHLHNFQISQLNFSKVIAI